MAQVEHLVDDFKALLQLKKQAVTSRTQLGEIKQYLAIYDYREAGRDWDEIAQKVDPRRYHSKSRITASVVENVRRNYRKVKRLIEGGYQHLK